jgi:hypothetical protein
MLSCRDADSTYKVHAVPIQCKDHEFATVQSIKRESFIYLDLMIKNMEILIEMYFKW